MDFNGLIELTPERRRLQAVVQEGAVSIERMWNDKTTPVIAWDSSLDAYISRREEFFDQCERMTKDVTPWTILKALRADQKRNEILIWNQGSIPSCCLTSASHAYQFSLLYSIALGASVKYDAVNPIYSHYGATGGRMGTGEDLFGAAEWINKTGNFPVSLVGNDNLSVPVDEGMFMDAANGYTVAVVPIEDPTPEVIYRLSRAKLPLFFGSSYYFGSATTDKNGIGIGAALSAGAHAETTGISAFEIGNERYVYIQNSHGNRYGSDRTGRPESGYYVTMNQLARLCESMSRYGSPCVVIPRGEKDDHLSFLPVML